MKSIMQEEIKQRAYALWYSEGGINGKDLDYWLQAEREIIAKFETARKSAGTKKRRTPSIKASGAKTKAGKTVRTRKKS